MQCELAGEVKALCDRMWRDLSGLKPFGLWLCCPALKEGAIDGFIVVLSFDLEDGVIKGFNCLVHLKRTGLLMVFLLCCSPP
jgi:hypothetical protein